MKNINQAEFEPVIFAKEEDYKKLLLMLKVNAKYISLFSSIDTKDKIILFAKENMKLVNQKVSNKFMMSRYSKKMPIYTFELSEIFYKYLKSFNYIFLNSNENDVKFSQDFTQIDMAFLDKEMNVIFFTITHEGIASLNKDYFNKI